MSSLSRRSFIKIAGVAGLALLSGCQDGGTGNQTGSNAVVPEPAPTELIITPTGELFVEFHSRVPQVDETDWRLRIFGLVEREVELTYEDVLRFPKIESIRTLECIGNPPGGPLVGNVQWAGFEAKHIWDQVGILPSAVRGRFSAADGYDTSVDLEWLTQPGVLMAYELNGAPLTQEHGHPLRILMPGLYGQKMPKWITGIEFVDNKPLGHWEQRGWSDIASVKTNSIIWQPDRTTLLRSGSIPIYGMAFAGLRRIVKVEVQIDEGEWIEAQLLPQDSPLVWTQWSFTTPLDSGNHTVTVRATDDEGFVQNSDAGAVYAGPFPDGSDDVHTVTFVVGD
jgi:DMSO/TMAO reductase YedYZ molybdopterin-dependent catalytic subunit